MNPTFFTASRNAHAEELRGFLPVNVNLDYGTIAPALFDAEQKYIMPLLGDDLADELADYYADEQHEADAAKDKVIAALQAAVVRIAYYDSFDLLAVNLTDSGVQNPNGEKAAYRYQADAAKETLARQAFGKLQDFYDVLVESGLRTWEPEDDTNPKDTHSVFQDSNEFFAAISQPRDFRLFVKMKQTISITETVELAMSVGSAIASDIRNRAQRVTSDVLRLAQRFVAYKSLADSIMFLSAYITNDGATVRSISAEGASGGTSIQPADIKVRESLKQHYEETARAAATQLVRLLRDNAASFPEIADIYPTDSIESNLYDNSNNKSTYIV